MLSQNDFRSLLAKGKTETKTKAAPKQAQPTKEEQERKREKRKRSYQEYLKRKEKFKKKKPDDSNYRDRTLERKQGKLLDYEDTAEALKNISAEHSKVLFALVSALKTVTR